MAGKSLASGLLFFFVLFLYSHDEVQSVAVVRAKRWTWDTQPIDENEPDVGATSCFSPQECAADECCIVNIRDKRWPAWADEGTCQSLGKLDSSCVVPVNGIIPNPEAEIIRMDMCPCMKSFTCNAVQEERLGKCENDLRTNNKDGFLKLLKDKLFGDSSNAADDDNNDDAIQENDDNNNDEGYGNDNTVDDNNDNEGYNNDEDYDNPADDNAEQVDNDGKLANDNENIETYVDYNY